MKPGVFYLKKIMNFMKMRTFYKKKTTSFYKKNSTLHTYKKTQTSNISFYKKNPFLELIETPGQNVAPHVLWTTQGTFR